MFLKLLVLSIICTDLHFASGENKKDIYELEFWSRQPKFSNRRSMNARPTFRFRKKILKGRVYCMANLAIQKGNAAKLFGHFALRWLRLGNSSLIRRIRRPLRDKDPPEPEDGIHKSTKIDISTPAVHLVEKSSENPEKKDQGAQQDKKQKDEREVDSSLEQLSTFSIKKMMEQISKDLGKETNISVEVLGRTFEYNDIVILKMAEKKSAISKYFRADDEKYIDEVPEKPIMFIVHGLTTKSIHDLPCLSSRKRFLQLLNYYVDHLDQFDIYLIPVANPDGYTKAFYDSTWNKNLSPQNPCNGVNLDRNFDVAWGGSSTVGSCSQNYPGPSAFSEPETRAIRDVFHRYGHKIVAYINVHAGSYNEKTYKGEAVLYPKGYTEAQTDDDRYMDMKGEIDETMRNASFQRVTVTTDSLFHWYGKVTGTSVDYASTVFGIPFAMEFVMETYDLSADSRLQNAALAAIWKKVIDAVFNFIHKKKDAADGQKR